MTRKFFIQPFRMRSLLMRQLVAIFTCILIVVSSTSAAWAQSSVITTDVQQGASTEVQLITVDPNSDTANSDTANADTPNQGNSLGFDITAPTITHTPPINNGVAGEVQTVVAEISDNQTVERASLVYRNSSADFFSTIEMSADVTNTTWLATVETTSDDTLVQYYIVAEDTDGNRVQKGSEGNPLTMQLQQPELFSAIAPLKNDNKNTWIGIGLGVLAAMVIIGASSGSGDETPQVLSDPTTTCCTITFVVPNVSD